MYIVIVKVLYFAEGKPEAFLEFLVHYPSFVHNFLISVQNQQNLCPLEITVYTVFTSERVYGVCVRQLYRCVH